MVLGFGAAVIDNACGGMTNIRSHAGEYATDTKDFNAGLTSGDVASIAIGGTEIGGGQVLSDGGKVTVAASLAAEIPSGGTSTVTLLGGAMKLHGVVMMAQGTANLANQKGHLKESDTQSDNSNQALNKAKNANDIPGSQQPDNTIKANTPEGKAAGLDPNKNVKQLEYTNNKGEKIQIRQDKPVQYPDGGWQGWHWNAGNAGENLYQHHYYGN